MMNEEKKISQYGDVPNISVRANGRRMWTPEEDKKLMLAATGANKMKALSEELSRSVASMYQRIHTLCEYESKYSGRRTLPEDIRALVVLWQGMSHKPGRKPKTAA